MWLGVYLAACVLIGWLGRRRMLGFWGNSVLAFFVSPLAVGIVLFAFGDRPKAPVPPARPVAT